MINRAVLSCDEDWLIKNNFLKFHFKYFLKQYE